MASIVSCPSCRKRLKIGVDLPGGKLRCPHCNTPFVLGNQTGQTFGGTPEFQAFEILESGKETLPPRPSQPVATSPVESSKATLPPPLEPRLVSGRFEVIDFETRTGTIADDVQGDESESAESTDDQFFLPKDFDPFAVSRSGAITVINSATETRFPGKEMAETMPPKFDVAVLPAQPVAPEIPIVLAAAGQEEIPVVEAAPSFEVIDTDSRIRRAEPDFSVDADARIPDQSDRGRITVLGMRISLAGLIGLAVALGILLLVFVALLLAVTGLL